MFLTTQADIPIYSHKEEPRAVLPVARNRLRAD
jgi:hypothetical protein